jgi:hypothetical protein
MFVRFRQTRSRLQCSLIETRRLEGKVRHEHIASLGAIEIPPSVADRFAFWGALHQRLARLANRVDDETKYKLIGQVHERIPIPSAEEQRQLQRENAEADERFWSSLQSMQADRAAGQRELIATAQRAASEDEAGATNAGAHAERAKERLAKIERGEDVTGGLGKPVDLEAFLLANGFTKARLRECRHMHALMTELERRGIEGEFWEAFNRHREAGEHAVRRRAERDVLRKHGLQWHGDD